MGNPRRRNGAARNRVLAWLRNQVELYDLPCHICGQGFDLSLPPEHPMALTADEVVPVSRYQLGGYESEEQCALDRDNIKPAHRVCNERRGNRLMGELFKPGGHFKPVNDATLPQSRRW